MKYTCNRCDTSFTRASNLRRHEKDRCPGVKTKIGSFIKVTGERKSECPVEEMNKLLNKSSVTKPCYENVQSINSYCVSPSTPTGEKSEDSYEDDDDEDDD